MTGSVGPGNVFSCNGNKIITTSGGSMLVSADKGLIEHARLPNSTANSPPSTQRSARCSAA
jgi:pyridoxal phosphate-dependent aminotransferase EpsN